MNQNERKVVPITVPTKAQQRWTNLLESLCIVITVLLCGSAIAYLLFQ